MHAPGRTTKASENLVKMLRMLAAWVGALVLLVIHWTTRFYVHDDPRPALKEAGQSYIYAILHAHQIAAGFNHGEKLCGAMVSRSADGDLLIPVTRVSRIRPFRGSGRKGGRDKGGKQAMTQLIEWVARTGRPCTMAVDGPRGPRNYVHHGAAKISWQTGAHVVVAVVAPKRRWILSGTWDRMQFPKPFTRIDGYFTEALNPVDYDDVEALRIAIQETLTALEERCDPLEAERSKPLREGRKKKAS